MAQPVRNLLGLDVGGRRIGVAAANSLARLVRPVGAVINDEKVWQSLETIIRAEQIDEVVIGLPRNMSGQETAQTAEIRRFTEEFQKHFDLPTYEQDETLTSRQAEAELASRGKQFSKGDIDALAAVYILEDYLRSERQ